MSSQREFQTCLRKLSSPSNLLLKHTFSSKGHCKSNCMDKLCLHGTGRKLVFNERAYPHKQLTYCLQVWWQQTQKWVVPEPQSPRQPAHCSCSRAAVNQRPDCLSATPAQPRCQCWAQWGWWNSCGWHHCGPQEGGSTTREETLSMSPRQLLHSVEQRPELWYCTSVWMKEKEIEH